ncbi:MAG TPA: acetyl-CoA carboxylase biotin carboxyl carrier protein subunit, partial [Candidatus Limnocylindrales bacterium]|nr:acetyl-CoA carboxylase biotin carboxyl carrier protein subunit [Candidatus Limnocylindrales bacterium]
DWAARTAIPGEAWRLAGMALLDADGSRDGWRLNSSPRIRLMIDDDERTIDLGPSGPSSAPSPTPAFVRVGDTVFVDLAGRSVPIRLAPPPDVDRAARTAASHHGGPAELVAPMPGAVIAVHRTPGERVEAGDAVVTLEAMKMEHVVHAPVGGTVAELAVRPGDQVVRGQTLAIVEP